MGVRHVGGRECAGVQLISVSASGRQGNLIQNDRSRGRCQLTRVADGETQDEEQDSH